MKISSLLACCSVALVFAAVPLHAREITDMAGRVVEIGDHPTRVFGSAPPVNVLLHVIAPDAMLGLNFAIPPEAQPYFQPALRQLPVVGVFGLAPQINAEAVLALKPDLALGWYSPMLDADKVVSTFTRMGLPVLFVKMDKLDEWPAALRFAGGLLQREARADELALYVETALARLAALRASVPASARPRIYYATDPDGLSTGCQKSPRAAAIELAGGDNVYQCAADARVMGMEKVSLEQVLAWQPDIIIAHDPAFIAMASRADSRWQGLKAVREGKLYFIPRWPHNWIDRPPSVMQALGAQWLASLFYPQDYPFATAAETRRFYRLFFGLDLDEHQLEGLFK